MIKTIFKIIASKKQVLFGLVLIAAIAVFVFAMLLFVDRPKGLTIHAPLSPVGLNETTASYIEPVNKSFVKISPASFSATFGVVYKEIEKPKSVIHPKKKIVEINKPQPKVKAKTLDLRSLGYRLTGLITGENETVVFLYDPLSKKNKVLRQNASDSIKIVHAWQRSVELITPKGRGVIELEHSKGGTGRISFVAGGPKKHVVKSVKPPQAKRTEPPQNRQRSVRAEAMISQGHLKPSRVRGTRDFALKVRSVPDGLKSFSLRKGDIIVGNEQNSFRSMKDVNNTLRSLQERPTILKVKRGRKTLFLKNKAEIRKSNPIKQGQKINHRSH